MEEKAERPAPKKAEKKAPGIKERLRALGNPPAQNLPARMTAVELRVAILEGKK